MGTGGSFFRNHDEDDVLGNEYGGSSNGVIKRIPIEVKPRGKLGLRSAVSSFGKNKKSGSLRSALSVDLDNPEVERIRKEFEMYRLNKDNEMASMQKKEQKLEIENKRLRAELTALQKTCRKSREERDAAWEAESQALVRAAAFENDRDKIQRQFKIFRETKENEIQTLLRARREVENRLSKLSHGALEEIESMSRIGLETHGSSNPGDWWTALESEPSLGGSTSQLHTHSLRGPEFAHSMMEMEGPFTNVNKDDWTAAAATLQHILPPVPEITITNIIYIYISTTPETQTEVQLFCSKYEVGLRKACCEEGRFLTIIHVDHSDNLGYNEQWPVYQLEARRRRVEQSNIILAFLHNDIPRDTEKDISWGHLNHPGAKPALFCFRSSGEESKDISDAERLRKKIEENGNGKVVSGYSSAEEGVEMAYEELKKMLLIELGVEHKRDKELTETIMEQEGPEVLCGGLLWDPKQDYDQLQACMAAARSTCELGFEKYYEHLHTRISAPGPLPPLLITGQAGSGKSLLLAKWIELQQQRTSGGLVLYHFVGDPTSSTADPVLMIRRLTAQLMQYVTSPPALTCDPVRLVEEFPRWLEKVSAKLPAGIILVLDAIDRFQQGESQLKWLLDPLPVDTRVIVSAQQQNCPQTWRSWPTLHIEELSNKNVRELLRAELASHGKAITAEQESKVLVHCRTPATCLPLYVVLLASQLACCSSEEQVDKILELLLESADAVQLYNVILTQIRHEYEGTDTRGLTKQVLMMLCASRNGLLESELFELLPELTWGFWLPLREALIDRHVLSTRSGVLVFSHPEAKQTVGEQYFQDNDTIHTTHRHLRDYFGQFITPPTCSYRVADELPWLDKQLGDKDSLEQHITNLCVFLKLYGRGHCGQLISYWQVVGSDRVTMAKKYQAALKQMEHMVGHFDGMVTLPRIADVYEALGRFLRDLNLLTEALIPFQRALEIRETALDPDHPSVAQTLHQVAGLHAQQAKFSTAELLYKQALEIYEGAFSKDHYLVAKELDALAILYQKQGKHELAEPLHKRAVSIRRKSKAPRVSSAQMRSVDPLKRRVLQLEELAMGNDSPDLARTLNELGVLYYLQNNVETAESFFRRSLEMRESVLVEDHPDLAQSLNNMAALYHDRKQYDKAQPLYERALTIRRKHFPSDHPSVASVINHLGALYRKMGKVKRAEPLYLQSLDIRERSFGATHPAVATALVNLAVLYSQQGKHTAAEPLYERALKIYEGSFGQNHPRVSETLKNMALLKYDQEDFETAARYYKRATEIKENDPAYAAKAAASRRSSSTEFLLNR